MHFSIVIPTYNRAASIAESLNSVLAQRTADDVIEFVIVDDSTDETLDVAKRAVPDIPGVTLVCHRGERRLGVTGARNKGIDLASGEVLVFLDSDDQLMPAALDHIRSFLTTNPHVDVLFGSVQNKSGRPTRRESQFLDRLVSYEEFVVKEHVGEFLPIVRRRVFQESNLRYAAELDGFEGVLWYRIARTGYKVWFSSTALRLYDDIGTDRNCDPIQRGKRADQLARGHAHELNEFGRDLWRLKRRAYLRKLFKAHVYRRMGKSRSSDTEMTLRAISDPVYRIFSLVPSPVARFVFRLALRARA